MPLFVLYLCCVVENAGQAHISLFIVKATAKKPDDQLRDHVDKYQLHVYKLIKMSQENWVICV